MKKPKPLWPITYVRAARWLDCHPRTVSRYARGRKVTFEVFYDLIDQRVGCKHNYRWWHTGRTAIWYDKSAEVRVYPFSVTVGGSPIQEILEAFHGIEGKQAPLSFAEIAEKFGITKEEAEAAIRFPW